MNVEALDEEVQRRIWESRCPALLDKCDEYRRVLTLIAEAHDVGEQAAWMVELARQAVAE